MTVMQRSMRRKVLRSRSRRPQRKGIVILIVVSMLVLFMLMLATFAVVSGHYRDSAKSFAFRTSTEVKIKQTNQVFDDILNMVLGEPSSQSSSLWGQSLLSDLYGESVNGVVMGNAASEGNGSFCAFGAARDPVQTFPGVYFSNVTQYHVGCVLTMKDGPCAGMSTRITHYSPTNVDNPIIIDPLNNPGAIPATERPYLDASHLIGARDPVAFRVETFDDGRMPQPGNRFVVNGKPFSGTGVGRPYPVNAAGDLDVSSPHNWYANDASDVISVAPPISYPWALMPHLGRWGNRVNAKRSLLGGANEPWDTFDFQNMFLALVPSDPNSPGNIKPSFHDQALLAYWDVVVDTNDDGNRNGSTSIYATAHLDLLRKIMFRPLVADHPNFASANPFFDPSGSTGNFWDVDNDGDGQPDSIWMDPGLPVATTPDGRTYKRLVAIMIRDLEGRANVNAVGSPEFVKTQNQPGTQIGGPLAGYSSGTPLPGVPRGLGVGPAEVHLLNMFQLDGGGAASLQYQQLIQGNLQTPGRYGLDISSPYGPNPFPVPANRRPGIGGTDPSFHSADPLSVVKTQGFGLGYGGPVFSNYATPSDVWGRGALALDYAGQPYGPVATATTPLASTFAQPTDWLSDSPGNTADDSVEIIDNPYEINLVDVGTGYDSPYTVAELEAVLRRFDADKSNLPSRLSDALNPNGGSFHRRASTTSAIGMSINAPRGAMLEYMRRDPSAAADYSAKQHTPPMGVGTAYLPGGSSTLEVCLDRIQYEINNQGATPPPRVPAPNAGNLESEKQRILKQIMPHEFFHGQLFDINRPFGNGIDDDGNGVVDEPGETDNNNLALQEPAWKFGPLAMLPAAGGAAWPLNDSHRNWWSEPNSNPFNTPGYLGYLNSDPHLYARQLYARNLYCLMLLLYDPTHDPTDPTTSSPPLFVEPGLNAQQKRKLFCRRMAQYAINAVDFRDSDAIMSPFEYDEFPFDGWHVDGNLTTDENTWLPNGERGLVWGMEQQDLVLKETISLHNRRTRDTSFDSTQKDRAGGDNDVDQLCLPQGSTFIELYCARARVVNNSKLPVELYNPVTGRLDVARMAPAGAYDSVQHPVWQIAISGNLNPDPNSTPNPDYRPNSMMDPALVNATPPSYPDSFSLEPTLNPNGPGTLQVSALDPGRFIPIQRYVWFGNVEPLAATGQTDNTFINSLGWDVSLDPGSYLVIGPRASTQLGALNDADPATLYDGPSQQAINLSVAGGVTITNTANTQTSLTPGNQIRKAVGMVADIHAPRGGVNTIDGNATTWPANGRRVGLSVTEPLPQSGIYYTFPTNANDAYDDLTTPTMNLIDKPFDYNAGMPLRAGQMTKTGTHARTHAVVLQRLANPLQGWHPQINPYINLDWAENDTTVFTGDENTNRQVQVMGMDEDVDPWDAGTNTGDPSSTTGARLPVHLRTRQRGNIYSGGPQGVLWNPQTATPGATSPLNPNPGVYFNYDLIHTLGFVNGIYGDNNGLAGPESTWASTQGYTLNGGIASPLWNQSVAKRDPADPDIDPAYVGDPNIPFPWIMWNNRPFANPMELMSIPTSSPQRIGQEFLHIGDPVPDIYSAGTASQGFFRHLENFFLTPSNVNGELGPGLQRLFDFVETPSPYVGTERWYQPNIANDTGYTSPVTGGNVGEGYRAPFNQLSRFRDPGKINVNTIVDPLVWNSIVATYPELQAVDTAPGTFWDLVRSRRGYPALVANNAPPPQYLPADNNTAADIFRSHHTNLYPSLVCNPIRPADAFDLQPLTQMQLNRPVDATLMRGNGTPLALDGGSAPTPGALPLLMNGITVPTNGNYYRASDRNSYFRYQPYTKLSNMLTTTSNTFAVWMTVGYFEVTPNTPIANVTAGGVDVAHPDGYQLGTEMTFDGVIRRPRAFFLIDRSIPVGYEPGHELNINKCVLQRRYLD